MKAREILRGELLQRFLDWAGRQPDVSAVILVGSSARQDHPADQWSDFDFVIVASDPQSYFNSTVWIKDIGCPWFTIFENAPDGTPIEVRTLFEGGLDMDFIFASENSMKINFQDIPMIPEIMGRGKKVLLDKSGSLSCFSVPRVEEEKNVPPSLDEFMAVVNDFWFHCAWTVKKVQRGELWMAARSCNHYLKNLVLQMMAWETQGNHGWQCNTWYEGRFVEEWAQPQSLTEFSRSFAQYDQEDIRRALSVSMDLFLRTSKEVASKLGFEYPDEQQQKVSKWIQTLH